MVFGFGNRQSLGELRKQMDSAIKQTIVPQLRASGFQGSYPHFRRLLPERTDLLSFDFSKYGGAFCIRIAAAPAREYKYLNDEIIAAGKLTAYHMPFDQSVYLRPYLTFFLLWHPYRFHRGQIARCVRQVQQQLPKAEAWWAKVNYQALSKSRPAS